MSIPEGPTHSLKKHFHPIADVVTYSDLKRPAVYGAASLLTGRINPVFISTSIFNGFVVSLGEKLGENLCCPKADVVKKLVIAVVSLAVSTLFVTVAFTPLLGRVGFAITRGVVIKLACFNVFGEAVLFALPILEKVIKGFKIDDKENKIDDKENKIPFTPPFLPKSTVDVTSLKERDLNYIRSHFENYAEMSTSVFEKFCEEMQNLDSYNNSMNKNELTNEDQIRKLDIFTVHRIFHANKDSNILLEDENLEKELNLRFYNANLPCPKGKIVIDLSSLKLPQTNDNLTKLSINKLTWIHAALEGASEEDKEEALSDVHVKNTLNNPLFKKLFPKEVDPEQQKLYAPEKEPHLDKDNEFDISLNS